MFLVPAAIETERLVLRKFNATDVAPFARLMTSPEATRFLAFPAEMKTQEGAKQLLKDTIKSYDTNKPFFALAIEQKKTGIFLGCCGVNPIEEQIAEIFYAVLPRYWRRGIATQVAQGLTTYLFQNTSVTGIKAFIVPGHVASERVAEKIGFSNNGLVENPNFKYKVYQFFLMKSSN